MFQVTVLGSSSATPAFKRHLTAQIVEHNSRMFLIDCGEATQFQLLRYKIKLTRLDAIFISHLHGDHFFGLVGLLCTLSNQERLRPLDLYCPVGLKAILQMQFKASDTRLKYELCIHELEEESSVRIFENQCLEVLTIPLQHRIYCNGFLFRDKPRRPRFDIEQAREDLIPVQYYGLIKSGNNVTLPDGRNIDASEYLLPPAASHAYAYCSDTRYTESILPLIQGVTVLYHEATFLHEMVSKAEMTMHSTAHEAADIALKAGVGRLILGHFSARYQDLTPLLIEARNHFPESYLSVEGEKVVIA